MRLSPGAEAELADLDLGCVAVAAEKLDEVAEHRRGVFRPRPRHRRLSVELLRCLASSPLLRGARSVLSSAWASFRFFRECTLLLRYLKMHILKTAASLSHPNT